MSAKKKSARPQASAKPAALSRRAPAAETKAQAKKQMYLHRHAAAPDAAPRLARAYDSAFRVTPAYRASLPDMMDVAVAGPSVAIQQVGVSGFKLPLRHRARVDR